MQPVFDGHNDVLLRLWRSASAGGDPVEEFIKGSAKGHIDLPRARKGGLAGGLCAIYVPSGELVLKEPDAAGHYVTPLSEPLEHQSSLVVAMEMAAIALRLERSGGWRLCRSGPDLGGALSTGEFAAVLHMEGCEAISPDLAELDVFYAAGLRSLGPVWSRNNIFGHGVPFAYPMNPDSGPGLTDAGRNLVKACNQLGILIDLSHITEKGFWDVARVTDQPLVASHSNVHAITPVARNLTDKQLDAIRERKGLVGLNFAVTMLRADGRDRADTPLSDMVRHVDHLVERLGIDCVALGSDFDGALIPAEIEDAAGLQNLVAALRAAGYGDDELVKICRNNWFRVLRTAWHETENE
ncbi:peptidase [Mesorhizobium sp. NBSH29]|uniref:dipeptidase n=1 Tax=Mesorhizobium sp. NBSH29 TaxID=2654249 RepID=UPI0018969D5D|nr:dipeptidase [Mesorhizobium sp. NBSH29]QPC85366.1 peptidase [Mesorhizobium sp. NBSH29]